MFDIRKLHEPISPAASGIYNALCSIIQAVPLAAVLIVLDNESIVDNIENGDWKCVYSSLDVITRMAIAIASIACVWHRYGLDNNFTCWRLKYVDTLIPFSFALIQSFLVISARHSNMSFGICFGVLNLAGSASYLYAWLQFKKQHSYSMILQHFGSEHGRNIHYIINAYFKNSFIFLLRTSIYIGLLLASMWLDKWKDTFTAEIIVDIGAGSLLLYFFADDSGVRLERYYCFVNSPKKRHRIWLKRRKRYLK